MDERSIVTASDLDAAIRAQQTRRWDDLWAEAQQTGLSKRDWVVLAFAGTLVALALSVLVVDPEARSRFLEGLPLFAMLFNIGLLLLGVYVNHTSRKVKALRKLLHGVLSETAMVTSGSGFDVGGAR